MLEGLMLWFEPRRGAYPWRSPRPDPYMVLVSEVMLQQTQAVRVGPAFERFVRRFPDVAALAEAPVADVIRAWAGLGYNRRAVRLSMAARAIVRLHGGRVPDDLAELRRLPGVGPYTAAAVASLAFGRPVPAVDTNVRRVVSRAVLGVDPAEVPPGRVATAAGGALDREDPGSWNQAVMDLGREVCRPVPRCERCPLAAGCRFRRSRREPAPARPRQGRFEGSFRETRGSVIRALVAGSRTVAELAEETSTASNVVSEAVAALQSEGLVELTPFGQVRLAEA
jgi:A/G-specific adenine glycosylase